MIKVEHMEPHEQVFTWLNPDTEEELNFAVTRMANWCKWSTQGGIIYQTPVELVHALMFIRDRGIETHRLERLNEDALKEPILYCEQENGSHLLVDGHHRYVYAATQGHTRIPAHILKPDQWKRFLVTGLPKYGKDAINRGFSGIM